MREAARVLRPLGDQSGLGAVVVETELLGLAGLRSR